VRAESRVIGRAIRRYANDFRDLRPNGTKHLAVGAGERGREATKEVVQLRELDENAGRRVQSAQGGGGAAARSRVPRAQPRGRFTIRRRVRLRDARGREIGATSRVRRGTPARPHFPAASREPNRSALRSGSMARDREPKREADERLAEHRRLDTDLPSPTSSSAAPSPSPPRRRRACTGSKAPADEDLAAHDPIDEAWRGDRQRFVGRAPRSRDVVGGFRAQGAVREKRWKCADSHAADVLRPARQRSRRRRGGQEGGAAVSSQSNVSTSAAAGEFERRVEGAGEGERPGKRRAPVAVIPAAIAILREPVRRFVGSCE